MKANVFESHSILAVVDCNFKFNPLKFGEINDFDVVLALIAKTGLVRYFIQLKRKQHCHYLILRVKRLLFPEVPVCWARLQSLTF